MLNDEISNKSDSSHNHDNRYYTETEIDYKFNHLTLSWNNISGKPSIYAPSSHNHDDRYFVNTTFADMMIVYTQDLSGDSALAAGEPISLSDTATTYDGYMSLCIVGIRNLSTPRAPQLVDFYKGGSNSINVRVLNDSDSSVNISIRFYILYVKSYFV